jgi:2-amino-4-hydroxy-6-hydroxymethyldihydropteridine diphosphokinase
MSTRPSVFLGLGSNLGDRELHLGRGRGGLADRGLHIRRQSALYLTEPVGGPVQPWFLNQVLEGHTDLSPEALLEVCLGVEHELLRVRGEKDGPRTLDLDILLYGDVVVHSDRLTLPHPRLAERLFVLVPLCDIAPDVRHPVTGLTAVEMRARCPDRSRVTLYSTATAQVTE